MAVECYLQFPARFCCLIGRPSSSQRKPHQTPKIPAHSSTPTLKLGVTFLHFSQCLTISLSRSQVTDYLEQSNLSAVAVPHAPRAMVQQRETTSEPMSLEPVFNNAAIKLYPRLGLFEALAKFKDNHKRRETSGEIICEARRDFLDSFAYLCDIEKGGGFVTATGLQKLPLGNILWLAANEGVREDVKLYAESILQRLKKVTPETRLAVRDDIFQLVVEKSLPRVAFYTSEMQKYARNCRMQLRRVMRDETGTG